MDRDRALDYFIERVWPTLVRVDGLDELSADAADAAFERWLEHGRIERMVVKAERSFEKESE